MNDRELFLKALLAWYSAEARDLPWRRTLDPYHVWLSEIILQQTRVDQGLPYYHRFLKAFPTLSALAAASEEAVMKQWEGLGYYTRARNLHAAARIVREQYHGRLPEEARLLQMLPGVGRYTAGAIASIAFGERTPVVDGNVKRVLSRLYHITESIDDPGTEKEMWALAEALVPSRTPGDFNQAMMELGARVCTPRKPTCVGCPVAAHCRALAADCVEALPVRREKKPVPHQEQVVAAIVREGEYLVGLRPGEGLLGGLWEFPTGLVLAGETHQQALRRTCREILGVDVQIGGLVATVRHAYSHFRLTLHVYRCVISNGEEHPIAHQELRWIAPKDFKTLPFPKANHKFLPLLQPPSDSEPDLFRGM